MEASPRRDFGSRGKEMIEKGRGDRNQGVGPLEFGKAWWLAGGDEFLRRPDVVAGRSCHEFCSVGVLGLLNSLEVPTVWKVWRGLWFLPCSIFLLSCTLWCILCGEQ